jgi:hypothetical protein
MPIHVVKNYESLPEGYRGPARQAQARAFHAIESGETYVIAKPHQTILDMKVSLWHEGGHFSLRNLAQRGKLKGGLNALLTQVKLKYRDEVKDFAKQFKVDLDEAAEERRLPRVSGQSGVT